MKKNKKKLMGLLAAVAVLLIATVGGTLAYFTSRDTRSNVITMGKVDGTLTETGEQGRDDGTTGKDYGSVKPGQRLAKDPKVTLARDSEDAYARIRINYNTLNEKQINELESLLVLNGGWSKSSDGYFYYNKLMEAGDSSTIFDEVKIPASWGNEIAGLTFTMDVTAEFIQADNFTPVIDEQTGNITGWGTVTVEKYAQPSTAETETASE